MSKGQRRATSSRRLEETRVAPPDSEEMELLTDQAYLPEAAPRSRSRSNETRMGPLDEGASETRMGPEPVAQRGGRGGKGKGPLEVSTEVRGAGAVAKVAKVATGWLAGGEKRGVPAGVVRLSPLEPAGGKVAPEEGSPLRTMFANHSALLAEELRAALSSKVYGRGPHRVLRIDEPEGPSTAGGKLARQSISLVPRKGSGPSLVCGWVDVSKREAQLRNFEAVAKRYEAHHGEPLELRVDEYERFLNDVEEVLTRAVIKVRVMVPEEAPGARAVAPAVARRKGVPGFWVLLIAALAFGLGVLVGRTPV